MRGTSATTRSTRPWATPSTRSRASAPEAWIGLGAIHVDLGDENELVVTTVFGEIYDPTVIEGERYALAKIVLSRL